MVTGLGHICVQRLPLEARRLIDLDMGHLKSRGRRAEAEVMDVGTGHWFPGRWGHQGVIDIHSPL